MSKLTSVAVNTLKEYNMLEKGDNVIVALSGGADSVALLHFLLGIANELHLNIMASHINHNLRGKEADRDEAFVKKLCEKYGVKLYLKSADVNKLAKQEKISTELCGRNVRYNFFEELKQHCSAKIATAHTASDNTETVLFNLTRGSGLKGISGIQPVREYIIRPLISVTRQQVEDYCKENNLDYVTDSSNLTDDYTRNKIRHNVIPSLKEINPEIDGTVGRTSKLFSDINDYFNQQVSVAVDNVKTKNGYDAGRVEKLHPAIKNAVVYNICMENGADVEYNHIKLICESLKGGAVDLPNSKRALISQNVLRIIPKENNDLTDFKIDLKENLTFIFNKKNYKVRYVDSDDKRNCLNPSLLDKDLFFRTRRQGDVFTLPFRNVTKTLKKLFNEMKIPAENRDKLLVLTDGDIIYWIEDIGASKQGLCNKKGIKIIVD